MSDGRESPDGGASPRSIEEEPRQDYQTLTADAAVNDARAMRITEVMQDFRVTCHRVTAMDMRPQPNERTAMGYLVMTQVQAEIRALLAQRFDSGASLQVPGGNADQIKRQLQQVLIDATSRRFKAQKSLLKASSATRWVARRRQILAGRQPSSANQSALQQADATLRMEVAAVTDQRVFNELMARDQAAGHWIAEMPDMATLMVYSRTH